MGLDLMTICEPEISNERVNQNKITKKGSIISVVGKSTVEIMEPF